MSVTRTSKFFAPLLKETPSDASIISHQLMLKSGMIRQVAAGIYVWLPLGLRVLQKVSDVVRYNLNSIGAQEIVMPCIQPASLWHRSGRIGSDDDLSKETLMMKDRKGAELLFTPTAEEVVSELFDNNVKTYKQLPMNLYQIQWKFRDEIRPRFGVMRGREFLMKDAYSFHLDKNCAIDTYNSMMRCYLNIFADLGLKVIPVRANSGSIGGDMSHEFHILANTGESKIYYEEALESYLNSDDVDLEGLQSFYAMEEEEHDTSSDTISNKKILEKRGIEVGHIFYLGDKYSKAMDVSVQGRGGKPVVPVMGCYGIGISRIVAAIIEAYHDDKGIKWPKNVAPYDVMLINLKPGDSACDSLVEKLSSMLEISGKDILIDDSDLSIGAKFASADLIGIPVQIIVGPKSLKAGKIEIKDRQLGTSKELGIDSISSINSAINSHS